MSEVFSFSKADVEIVSKEPAFSGFFKVNVFTFKHRLFNGGWSPLITREIFERGDAVAVLPYDPKLDAVLFVEQIRIGSLRTRDNPWLLECIAGMVEPGEPLTEVALREAQEEANIQLQHVEPMLNYLSSPGGTSERMYLYVAQADLSQAGGVFGLPEEGEDIRVRVLSLKDALHLLAEGHIDNAVSVIALQWLQLNRERLRQQWQTSVVAAK